MAVDQASLPQLLASFQESPPWESEAEKEEGGGKAKILKVQTATRQGIGSLLGSLALRQSQVL